MNSPANTPAKIAQGDARFELKHELIKCMDKSLDKGESLEYLIYNIKRVLLGYDHSEQPLPKVREDKVIGVRH